MDRALHVLCVGHDPNLPGELEAALEGVRGVRCQVHAVRNQRAGVEVARDRTPDLIVVEMGPTVRTIRTFAEEVLHAAPDTTLAATYAPGEAGDGAGLFVEGLRIGVKDFLRRPLSSGELQQLIDRLVRDVGPKADAGGAVVSFVSNKGGVGKSTLSVNTACALGQRAPDRVLLIDSSLQLGTCASMLDLTPATTISDAVREYDRLDETLLRELSVQHASGCRLLASPHDPAEAYDIEAEQLGRIISLARRAFDHIVVDTFPLLDDHVVTILDLSDRTYVVTNATVPTVIGTARLVKTLEKLGTPVAQQRVVLNLNHPEFPGQLAATDIAERLQRDIDHLIPYQKQLLTAVNTGQPYVLEASRALFGGAFARAFTRLVDEVAAVRPTGAARARRLARPGSRAPEVAASSGDLLDPASEERVDLHDSYVVVPDSDRMPTASGRLFPELVDESENGRDALSALDDPDAPTDHGDAADEDRGQQTRPIRKPSRARRAADED